MTMIYEEQKEITSKNAKTRLLNIANILLLNASFIDNLGLFNGKMGIAIFLYKYSRYTGNKIFEDFAGELIDEIYKELDKNITVDFANGLTGIGWGIELLVTSKFLEADTDDALLEIDNAIYRHRMQNPILLNNGNDLFGYGLYYLARINSHVKEGQDETLSSLLKKHHLIYLIDECEKLLINRRYLDFNILSLSIYTINSLLWFLLRTHELGIFPTKVNKLLECIPEYLTFRDIVNNENLDIFILSKLLYSSLKKISNITLKNKFQTIIEKNFTDLESINNDIILINCLGRLNIFDLLYMPYVNSTNISIKTCNRVINVSNNEEFWNQKLESIDKTNLGLNGLAGLGLLLLKIESQMKSKFS
jgi:hypothetical protein